MKNIRSITLLAALIIVQLLFIQCSKENNGSNQTEPETATGIKMNTVVEPCADSVRTIKIVYVDYDSLLANYSFAQEIHKELIRREMSINNTIDEERKRLQEEAIEFERKVQNNIFLTQELAQAEYEKIMQKDRELMERGQAMIEGLEEERNQKYTELTNCINSYIKQYNKCRKYDFILTKIGGNMLFANEALDITGDIVKGLNKNFKNGFHK